MSEIISWGSLFMSSANIEYICHIGQHWVHLCQVISVCLFLFVGLDKLSALCIGYMLKIGVLGVC